MKDKTEERVDIPSILLSAVIVFACNVIALVVASPMVNSPTKVVTDNYLLVAGVITIVSISIAVVPMVLWQKNIK